MYRDINDQKGFTLVELMMVLAVLGLLLGIGLPSLSGFFAKQQADAATSEAWRHLVSARDFAVSSRRRVTFCGLNDQGQCANTGIVSFVVFVDYDQDYLLSDSDYIYAEFDSSYPGQTELYASRKPSITFNPSGSARQFGSVFFCPKANNKALIRRISINRSGRSYIAKSDPNKGYVLAAGKKEIECS